MSLSWLIPNHYPPWNSFYNECAMAVALIALAAIACAGKLQHAPLAACVLVAVAFLPWLQWAAGLLRYTSDAWVSSAYLVATAAAVWIGDSIGRVDRRRLAAVLSGCAAGVATLSASIAISQALLLVEWGIWAENLPPGARAVGNLGQPNNFATLLGIGLLGIFYLFERGRLNRIVAGALVALCLVAAATTQSRISLLFGPAALAVVYVVRRRADTLKTPVLAIGAFAQLHWALMWSLPGLLSALVDSAPGSLSSRGIETPRFRMWQMLIEAVNTRPLTGFGWLQVGAAELSVVDRHPPIEELWLQAHNVFLDLVIWCGWPIGIVLSLSLTWWYFSRLMRVFSLEAVTGILAITFVGLHALVELPHQYLYFLVPVGLWAGLVESERRPPGGVASKWLLAPVIAALVAFFGIVKDYPTIEDEFRFVRFEHLGVRVPRTTEPANAPFMSSLTAFLSFARTEPSADMRSAQLAEMSAQVGRYPYAASLSRYARALVLNKQDEEARKTFVKIRYLFGDKAYERYRDDLRDKSERGLPGALELDRILPPTSSLTP